MGTTRADGWFEVSACGDETVSGLGFGFEGQFSKCGSGCVSTKFRRVGEDAI